MTALAPIRTTLAALCRARGVAFDDVTGPRRAVYLMAHRRALARELARMGYPHRRIDWVFNRKIGASRLWVNDDMNRARIKKSLLAYYKRKAQASAPDSVPGGVPGGSINK